MCHCSAGVPHEKFNPSHRWFTVKKQEDVLRVGETEQLEAAQCCLAPLGSDSVKEVSGFGSLQCKLRPGTLFQRSTAEVM